MQCTVSRARFQIEIGRFTMLPGFFGYSGFQQFVHLFDLLRVLGELGIAVDYPVTYTCEPSMRIDMRVDNIRHLAVPKPV